MMARHHYLHLIVREWAYSKVNIAASAGLKWQRASDICNLIGVRSFSTSALAISMISQFALYSIRLQSLASQKYSLHSRATLLQLHIRRYLFVDPTLPVHTELDDIDWLHSPADGEIVWTSFRKLFTPLTALSAILPASKELRLLVSKTCVAHKMSIMKEGGIRWQIFLQDAFKHSPDDLCR